MGHISKLVSANFYHIFVFSPNDSLSKTMNNVFFFFQLKSSHSWDIQIFAIVSLPNFSDSKGQMEEQIEME